jgi:epoxyqueuosine reductase
VPEDQASTERASRSQRDTSRYQLDARRCITYLNIELKGSIPLEFRASLGENLIGCDICQDVCPWNRRAPFTQDSAFAATYDPAPKLESLARLSEEEFEERYRHTPVTRPKYDGFLRNVAVAMGASPREQFREPLEYLAGHRSPLVAEHALWALGRLDDHKKEQSVNACVETVSS